MTDAHDQKVTRHFTIHYPWHYPRAKDPHYVDFEAYRKRTRATAVCAVAQEVGDNSECTDALELHHSHIEFALQNGVDLRRLEAVYPGVSDRRQVGAWVESAENLQWLCSHHHRAAGSGVHSLDASNFEASKFVRNLGSP